MNEYLESFKKNISTEEALLFEKFEKQKPATFFEVKCFQRDIESLSYFIDSGTPITVAIDALREINGRYINEGYHGLSLEHTQNTLKTMIRGWRGENEKEYTNRILEEFKAFKYRTSKKRKSNKTE